MSFIKIFDKINENYIFFLVILLFVLNSLKLFYTLKLSYSGKEFTILSLKCLLETAYQI